MPAPQDIAQAMGFPPHAFWETVDPRLGLALLGNAISPLHGARALGKLSILCAMLQQSPLPADFIASTTDHILRLADHSPAKLVTAPISTPKDFLQHGPETRPWTGATPPEEREPTQRTVVSSVAITIVTPGPHLIRVDIMDDRTMTDFKIILHLLGHLPAAQGTFALDGRPFLDHASAPRRNPGWLRHRIAAQPGRTPALPSITSQPTRRLANYSRGHHPTVPRNRG